MALFIECLVFMLIKDLCLSKGLQSPFTETPKNQTYARAGSDVELKWNYNHPKVDNIVMNYERSGAFVLLVAKDNNGVIQKGPSVPDNLTSRVTIEGNATLVISNVTTADSTKYSCVFTPLGGSAVQTEPVELIVSKPPDTVRVTVTPDILVMEGDTATLVCNADGIPFPELRWYRIYTGFTEMLETTDKIEITNKIQSTSLTIKQVDYKFHGVYTCRANNIAGEKNVSTVLAVRYFREIKGQPLTVISGVEVGDVVTLSCPVFGFPQPAIVWSEPGGRKTTDYLTNIFLVTVPKTGGFGEYKCSSNGKTFAFKLEEKAATPTPKAPGSSFSDTVIGLIIVIVLLAIAIIVLAVFLYRAKKAAPNNGHVAISDKDDKDGGL